MHRSLVSMQDLPIISEQGVRLGAIQDAYFDPLEQRVIAFVVDWENELVVGPENVLPIMQISEMTAEVATVPEELGVTSSLEYDTQTETEGLMHATEQLVGKPVCVADGHKLGELVDLQFDPQDGSVAAYEIAEEPLALADLPNLLLTPVPDINFQDDGIVVPKEAEEQLRRQTRRQTAQALQGEPRVTFLEEEDEPVGEDDVQVIRSSTTQPY